jgi:hypothetical protein
VAFKRIKNRKYRAINFAGTLFWRCLQLTNTPNYCQIAQNEGINPKNCISTGDIIGCCAQPEETIQFFKIGMPRIAGNAEFDLTKNAEGCDFYGDLTVMISHNLLVPFCKNRLSYNSLSFSHELQVHKI